MTGCTHPTSSLQHADKLNKETKINKSHGQEHEGAGRKLARQGHGECSRPSNHTGMPCKFDLIITAQAELYTRVLEELTPATEEMTKWACAPHAMSATMSRWSGMVAPLGRPEASLRSFVTTLPIAMTCLASPTHLPRPQICQDIMAC